MAWQYNRHTAFGPDLPNRLNLDLFVIKVFAETRF